MHLLHIYFLFLKKNHISFQICQKTLNSCMLYGAPDPQAFLEMIFTTSFTPSYSRSIITNQQ